MRRSGAGGQPKLLAAAQSVTNPNRSRGNDVTAELIRESIHKMHIELRPDEEMLRHVKLNACPDVCLEMAGSSHR